MVCRAIPLVVAGLVGLAAGQEEQRVLVLAAGDYAIDWWTIDGGGGTSSSLTGFELTGTIGQWDAGTLLSGAGYELTGGFWVHAAPSGPALCAGDMNCDGIVDYDDIDPFVAALAGEEAYLAEYPDCLFVNADASAGAGGDIIIGPNVTSGDTLTGGPITVSSGSVETYLFVASGTNWTAIQLS